MKRKKWSELEEKTLLSKYSDLLHAGTLAKLKTREKKFKPIADQVNTLHHHRDPVTFPFKWTWRDVSIKVQNMRHQYLGVKQKIRVSDNQFNWKDGENHWENFLHYKEVFGDVELEMKERSICNGDDVLGLGFDIDTEDFGEDGELREYGDCDEREDVEDQGIARKKRLKDRKRLGLLGGQVLKLREAAVRREERRSEREWSKEEEILEREGKKRERDIREEMLRDDRDAEIEMRELELEEREMLWYKRELERRLRFERELEDERRRRMKMEERWEEEEMEWREKMMRMQIEHEKQVLQMHADACQSQMQIIGAMARLVCHFFGSANDGLGGGLGPLPPQVLQNLQHHTGSLGENGKPDSNSPSEFL